MSGEKNLPTVSGGAEGAAAHRTRHSDTPVAHPRFRFPVRRLPDLQGATRTGTPTFSAEDHFTNVAHFMASSRRQNKGRQEE
ncbi:hypothetical protein SLNWT_5590 [Streptomyces albus]|uniref:Uncharacterized protein n=1 Tax=Streptomyces albus (strain ATCC 21838 / DSM 41398 / FERM P-419 / JCM 4703 / NBRC 107858) TaxID=1081613 RepID=A0A0B5F512_STRA4|nr:hypothetical protein SLNWT_5590 [Streptomyces albus]